MSGSIRLSPKHGLNPSMGVCLFCGEDDGTIVLPGLITRDRRGNLTGGDPEAPRRAVWSYEPCPKCAANMARGITLMEAEERDLPRKTPYHASERGPVPTGRWLVVTEDCVRRMFNPPAMVEATLRHRKAYLMPDAFAKFVALTEAAAREHAHANLANLMTDEGGGG